MAHNGPVRLILKGDRVAAARYVRLGRVLLWKLAKSALVAGVKSAQRAYPLPDNGLIEVGFAGTLAMITITVPEGGAKSVKVDEHFVVWARTEENPAGIDTTHPQQMLRFEDGPQQWRTLFFSAGVAGYTDFERPKGTYATDRGTPAFPDGVRHAGNVDWVNAAGVRVSWYGPSTRYFYDPFRQPRSQYGKFVFMLGQVLLDVEQYILDSAPDDAFAERYVMGAALTKDLRSLIVVMADLPLGTTNTAHIPGNTVSFPETWPLADVPITVARFAVSRNTALEQVMRYAVVPQSRELLYSGPLRNPYNPWFFNASATAAVCVGLPDRVSAVYPFAGTSGQPSASNPIWTLTVEDDAASVSATTVSLAAAAGSLATVAVDFKGDTLVQMRVRRGPVGEGSVEGFTFETDDAAFAFRSRTFPAAPSVAVKEVTEQYIQHADLREGEMVVLRLHVQHNTGTNTTVTSDASVDVWCLGAKTGSVALDLFDVLQNGVGGQMVAADEDWRTVTASASVSPQFALYGAVGGVDFVTTFIRWTGAHGGMRYLGHDPNEYFSQFGVYATGSGGPARPMSIYCSGGFDSQLDDFDGKTVGLGCATYAGMTVYSGPALRDSSGESIALVCSPESGATLATLTSVTGTKVRYHPVWLLGALPRLEIL